MHCNICGKDIEKSEGCQVCGLSPEAFELKVRIPTPRGAVNDFPGILTEDQVGELSGMVEGFFERTDVPIVITIVDTTAPLKPAEYAFLLYNHWGIGKPKVNRGLLLLLCLKEQHLESEVGLGLEKYLPEETGDWIVQHEFISHFKGRRYFDGLKAGAAAIIAELEDRLPAVH